MDGETSPGPPAFPCSCSPARGLGHERGSDLAATRPADGLSHLVAGPVQGLNAGPALGTVVTRPLTFEGGRLYVNEGNNNHWLEVRLQGDGQSVNRAAIGARIRVEVKAGDRTRSVFRDVNSGGSFGANPLRQTIGLGKAEQIESVEIFWPATGRAQTFRGLAVDCVYRIVEDETVARIVPAKTVKLGG